MDYEQLIKENELAQRLVAVASTHTLLLHANGRVTAVRGALLQDFEAARKYDKGQTDVEGAYGVTQVATDYLTSFMLMEDGTVTYAGMTFEDIDQVETLTDVKAIACGTEHFVALKTDGTVVAYGNNDTGACNVSHWKDIVKIVCSCSATFGVKADGTVLACGNNHTGICNVSDWKNIVNVFASMYFAIGVKADGTLVYSGEVPEHVRKTTSQWTDVVTIAGGDQFMALKRDGTAYLCDEYGDESVVSSWNNLVAVACDDGMPIAVRRDGYVKACQNRSAYIKDYATDYNGIRLFENIETFEEEQRAGFEQEKEKRLAAQNRANKKKTVKTVRTLLVILAVLAALAYIVFAKGPEFAYNKGVAYMESGEYGKALTWFSLLDDYKDTKKHTETCNIEKKKQQTAVQLKQLDSAEVGDVISFGFYEQDNKAKNGEEEIEWIVLAEKNRRILIISKNVLDMRAYVNGDDAKGSETWATSEMREWLNGEFYTKAFPQELSHSIVSSKLENPGNDSYGTKGGKATTDKVFLFSIEDANKYLSSPSKRTAEATKWVRKTYDTDKEIGWQLRSSHDGKNIIVVEKDGGFEKVNPDEAQGIRPVMWLTMK